MSRLTSKVLLTVSVLTALLYAVLSFPEVFARLGNSRPEAPLFLDFRDAAGSPHLIPIVSWRKVLLVIVVAALYAATVVGVVRRWRRAQPQLIGTVVVLVPTLILLGFWNWPDLTMALGEQLQAQGLSRRLVRFYAGFPGDGFGLTVAFAVLQTLITLGILTLMARQAAGSPPRT